jgi:transcriptional regulator with XRE-family HTH domain
LSLARYARLEKLPYGTQSKIARKFRVSPSFVSLVMNDKAAALKPEKVQKVQDEIAKRLGMPVEEVFPSRQAA